MKKEAAASPYSGQETRDIKALSDDERRRLLEGHGMGMALPAELNRYPGPKHVLELAGELDLRRSRSTQPRPSSTRWTNGPASWASG